MKRNFLLLWCIACIIILLSVNTSYSQLIWQNHYYEGDPTKGNFAQQTADGGYILVGFATPGGGYGAQVYVVKTDSFGDALWERTYGGTGNDYGKSVQHVLNGCYIVVGNNAYEDVYLIKTDSLGDTLWTRTYGGSGPESGNSVQQTTDEGYIVAGSTYSFGNGSQVYLIKTDSLGDILWTRTYGGASWEYGNSVQQTTDEGYIVAGSTNSFGNGSQVYLIKTDSLGDTLWTRTHGGVGYEYGNSVQQTTDGGYIAVGYTSSFGNDWQAYLIKTDSLGDTLWTRIHGGAYEDYGNSVQQTTDEGYIFVGSTYSPLGFYWSAYSVKTDSLGSIQWAMRYGGTWDEYGNSVQRTADGGYIIAGSYCGMGSWMAYLIKTDANGNGGIEENSHSIHMSGKQYPAVHPNPFSWFAEVVGYKNTRFMVYDISGKHVGGCFGSKVGIGLSSGVYYLIPMDENLHPMRVVKIK